MIKQAHWGPSKCKVNNLCQTKLGKHPMIHTFLWDLHSIHGKPCSPRAHPADDWAKQRDCEGPFLPTCLCSWLSTGWPRRLRAAGQSGPLPSPFPFVGVSPGWDSLSLLYLPSALQWVNLSTSSSISVSPTWRTWIDTERLHMLACDELVGGKGTCTLNSYLAAWTQRFLCVSEGWVAQSCLTLCDPIDCSPPGSSVHGVLQARRLERVAMPSSRGSSWPRDPTESLRSPALAGRFFTTSATWEAGLRG